MSRFNARAASARRTAGFNRYASSRQSATESLVVFVLTIGLSLLGLSPVAAQDSVHGRVMDRATAAPLPDAWLELRMADGSRRTLEVQADGTFMVPAAATSAVVSHVGYASQHLALRSDTGVTVRLDASPLQLDQVTVTATRAAKRLEDAPGSVSVIGRASLDTRAIARVDQAVGMTPGVYNHRSNVLDDGHGSLELRGLPGQKRTLVLMDGVPMNDGYNGGFRFAGFAAEDLERVEIVRGPSSSLYGGYAMGGAVNFVTRMPERRTLRADFGYSPDLGTANALHAQRRLYVSAGDRFGALSVLASYTRHATDGYVWGEVNRSAREGAGELEATGFVRGRDRTGATVYTVGSSGARGVEDDAITAKLAWQFSPATRVTVTGMRVTQQYGHAAPSTLLREPDGAPVWSGSVGIDDDGGPVTFSVSPTNFLASYGGKQHAFVSGRLDTRVRGAEVKAVAAYSDFESWYSTYDGSATFEGGSGRVVRNPTPSFVTDIQTTLSLSEAHVLTVGAVFKRDRGEVAERDLSNWQDTTTSGDLRYQANGTVTTMAAFAQDELRLGDAVTAYLGLRLDRWRTHDGYANDVGKPDYPVSYAARSSSFLSPRVALVLRPAASTRLKLSASRAFRGPTVFELYRTWTLSTGRVNYANPELGPETMLAFDAGVQQRFGDFTATVTVFRNDLRDMINRRTLDNGDGLYINTGKAVTQGLELQAERRLGNAARLFANYTWTDTEVIDNETAPETEGKELTGMPKHLFNAGAELLRGPWTLGAHGRYVGKRWATDTNIDTVNGVFGSSDPFFVLDLHAAYQWRAFRISASLDNALDRRYYDYNLAPGRTLMLRAGFDLQ